MPVEVHEHHRFQRRWRAAARAKTTTTIFDTDEGPRADTSLEALAQLKPAFHAHGTVTAGNSSQMSDGAAASVVMSAERARALGVKPLARFLAFATAGCAPEEMGVGPVYAIPKALQTRGTHTRSDRRDRTERSLRRASPFRDPTGRARSRARQRQWRRHRSGPSAGLHRSQAHGHYLARTRAPQGALRHGYHVHRRRHGRRRHFRAPRRNRLATDRDRTIAQSLEALMATTATTGIPRSAAAVSCSTSPRPEDVFTPAELTDDQRLIGQTAEEFVTKEVTAADSRARSSTKRA